MLTEIAAYCEEPSKVQLVFGLVGAFCLSWVGAICDDSTAPSCLGNNAIHTTGAMIFIVLYDLKMLFSLRDFRDVILCGLACAATTASLATSDWPLAVAE